MTVKELLESLKNREKEVSIIETIPSLLNIKNYLSYVDKKIICEYIVERSLDIDNDGLVYCDYFIKEIAFNVEVLRKYANLEFNNEHLIEEYDELVKLGIINIIKMCLNPSELKFIETMIDKEIEQRIKIENSLSKVMSKTLNRFIDMVDKNTNPKELRKLSKSLLKDLNNFNWDAIPQLKEIFVTVLGNQDVK